jgi:hypothetical protein
LNQVQSIHVHTTHSPMLKIMWVQFLPHIKIGVYLNIEFEKLIKVNN